uniref:Secreted protein n=1 Tax=Arion vulgaris TaxID=1028688 RepID=A0A0B7AYE3_9EUPU
MQFYTFLINISSFSLVLASNQLCSVNTTFKSAPHFNLFVIARSKIQVANVIKVSGKCSFQKYQVFPNLV